MIAEEVRSLLRAQPFIPFALHLSDGTVLQVPHPDYAAPTPNGAVVYVFHMNAGTDRVIANQITRISTAAEAEMPD